jgi:uncharacterized protein (DUF302 family)
MTSFPVNGMVHLRSPHSIDATCTRLESALNAHGLEIFCTVDHSGAAAKVGLSMRPTKLVIFGNPKGGTPPMLAAPTLAIDLPLKALVWEDADGQVWLTYNDSDYLQHRHAVPPELMKNLSGAAAILQKVVE